MKENPQSQIDVCGLLTTSIIILPDSPWTHPQRQLLPLIHFRHVAAKTCSLYFCNTCQNDLPLPALILVSALMDSCLGLLMGFFASSSFFSFYSLNCHHSFTLQQVLSHHSKTLCCSAVLIPRHYHLSVWLWKPSKNDFKANNLTGSIELFSNIIENGTKFSCFLVK